MHTQGEDSVPGCHEDGVGKGGVAGGKEAAGGEKEEDGVLGTWRSLSGNDGRQSFCRDGLLWC